MKLPLMLSTLAYERATGETRGGTFSDSPDEPNFRGRGLLSFWTHFTEDDFDRGVATDISMQLSWPITMTADPSKAIFWNKSPQAFEEGWRMNARSWRQCRVTHWFVLLEIFLLVYSLSDRPWTQVTLTRVQLVTFRSFVVSVGGKRAKELRSFMLQLVHLIN